MKASEEVTVTQNWVDDLLEPQGHSASQLTFYAHSQTGAMETWVRVPVLHQSFLRTGLDIASSISTHLSLLPTKATSCLGNKITNEIHTSTKIYLCVVYF